MSMLLDTISHLLQNAPELECHEEISHQIIAKAYQDQGHPNLPGTKYRASSIGRPWILQVLDRWYGKKRKVTVSNITAMLSGRLAQALVSEIFNLAGVEYQEEVTVHYCGVTGHADFVVVKRDEVLVIECKSMASYISTTFRNNPSDRYGYVSQLSFYWECIRRLHPDKQVSAMFVIFNRDGCTFNCVPLAGHTMKDKIERIQYATNALTTVKDYDVDELLRVVDIPPCVAGKLPEGMSTSRWASVLYANDGDGWYNQDLEIVARQLKQMPQQREDYTPLL